MLPNRKLSVALDDLGLEAVLNVAQRFGQAQFGYLVTPNVDHIIRLHDEPAFRDLYAGAALILLDSRFLAYLLRLTWQGRFEVCAGSDLTSAVFSRVIQRDDKLTLIGGSPEQAEHLRHKHGLTQLRHYNPPMGFIHDPAAVQACLKFIEEDPASRFYFLAIGSPQQEMLAAQLKERGVARGLALCIGASIRFITGEERRAPKWLQRIGFEWLYRLLQDPRRLAHRYLVRGPRIFWLMLLRVKMQHRSSRLSQSG